MRDKTEHAAQSGRTGKGPRGWIGLFVGLGLLWMLTYVVLPWSKTLPYIQPVMQAIDASDIDAGAYWYTQSEETAIAQMYVGHAIANQ